MIRLQVINQITKEFREGTSVTELALKYDTSKAIIEDLIRLEYQIGHIKQGLP